MDNQQVRMNFLSAERTDTAQKQVKNESAAVETLQKAFALDRDGYAVQAIENYKKAIALGLSGEDLLSAHVCLGSSYRAIGEYEKAKYILLEGLYHFPDSTALKTFLSLVQYNREQAKDAVEGLLKLLLDTTRDKAILEYKAALAQYAKNLDRQF